MMCALRSRPYAFIIAEQCAGRSYIIVMRLRLFVTEENPDANANCLDVVAAEKNVSEAAKCLKKGAAEGAWKELGGLSIFRIRGNGGKYWQRPWRFVNATP